MSDSDYTLSSLVSPDSVLPTTRKRWGLAIIPLIAVGMTLVGAIWGLLTANLMAPQFLGHIRVQFLPPVAPHTPTQLAQRVEPLNVETEVRLLNCRENLLRVVNEQNLVKKWALTDANQAADRLDDMVKVRREENTELATVEVRSVDMNEASELANAVGRAYEARTKSLRAEQQFIQINAMETELEQAKKKAEESRVNFLALAKKLGVPTAEATTPEDLARATELDQARREFETKRDFATQLEQIAQMKKLAYILPTTPLLKHEEAHANHKVVGPHFGLSMAWGALGGSGIGLVLGLLMATVNGAFRKR